MTYDLLQPLSQCLQTKAGPSDGVDNDCDGSIDEEILNRKDDDEDQLVDEDFKKVVFLLGFCCGFILVSNNSFQIIETVPEIANETRRWP